MEISLPWGELAWLIAALLAGGLLMGFLAGLFGIGGGGILVPILYEVFNILDVPLEVRMHLAVGTSLAVIIPTSIRSVQSHYKRGAVDMDVLRRVGPPVLAGVLTGIVVASFVQAAVLKVVYILTTSLMALNLYFGRGRWNLGTEMPGKAVDRAVGWLIGTVSALMGIGGGVQLTTYMTLYGRKIHQAVATGAGLGPIIAIPGALGYVWAGWDQASLLPPGSLGYVSLLGFAIIGPVSVYAAPIGVRVAHGLSRRKLEVAFAIFLTLMSIRFLISLFFQV
ncbi:sulfite exporter TauE/SafE family protein [Dichotomicrobium thermohalophilum]|uniref:Probable membrane transporter protein n=1 Tax=Dichotomicrobium thermohalophilum TaxID=933063 RepID=A0A397QAZ5_9HYPH|nr:sulfite exporter TauE/SafE family protein [Dichotomicrobium thermohalophilum]RIA56657.1 putative membrane protein YfcA [Dichotomicrobium thermohalophilum]